jgi:hypothetical protein
LALPSIAEDLRVILQSLGAELTLFSPLSYSKHTAMLIQLQELGLVKDPVYPEHKKLNDPRF